MVKKILILSKCQDKILYLLFKSIRFTKQLKIESKHGKRYWYKKHVTRINFAANNYEQILNIKKKMKRITPSQFYGKVTKERLIIFSIMQKNKNHKLLKTHSSM